MEVIEQIGVVTTRSGVLIVIDTGYPNLWSHNQRPVLPDGVLDSEEATAQLRDFFNRHACFQQLVPVCPSNARDVGSIAMGSRALLHYSVHVASLERHESTIQQ